MLSTSAAYQPALLMIGIYPTLAAAANLPVIPMYPSTHPLAKTIYLPTYLTSHLPTYLPTRPPAHLLITKLVLLVSLVPSYLPINRPSYLQPPKNQPTNQLNN